MKTVLITGTSTGIGHACATRLAGDGWTVFAGVRSSQDADRLKQDVQGDVRPMLLDVSDRQQIGAAVQQLDSELGSRGLGGLVNNAGIGTGAPFEYESDDDWRRTFDVNLFGLVALTHATLPLLRAARGRIVHMGSIGGRLASPGLGAYSASKHALEALAESQRHELRRAGTGIRVALIEPGEVKTAIWDKADTTIEELERRLDDDGRRRYDWLLKQSLGFIAEGRRRGVDPDAVARAVEHALTARRPKARYLVGPDAKVFGHVVTRMPDRVRDAMVNIGSKRWERMGRGLARK